MQQSHGLFAIAKLLVTFWPTAIGHWLTTVGGREGISYPPFILVVVVIVISSSSSSYRKSGV